VIEKVSGASDWMESSNFQFLMLALLFKYGIGARIGGSFMPTHLEFNKMPLKILMYFKNSRY